MTTATLSADSPIGAPTRSDQCHPLRFPRTIHAPEFHTNTPVMSSARSWRNCAPSLSSQSVTCLRAYMPRVGAQRQKPWPRSRRCWSRAPKAWSGNLIDVTGLYSRATEMFSTEIRYTVVRYMLNELGDEAANVGIVAIYDDPPRFVIRLMPDPTLKSRGDAKVNKDSIDRYFRFVNTELDQAMTATSSDSWTDRAFARLNEIGGNVVRLSAPRSVLTNDISREIDLL